MNLDKLRFADGSIRTSELRLSMQKGGIDTTKAACMAAWGLTAGGPVPYFSKSEYKSNQP